MNYFHRLPGLCLLIVILFPAHIRAAEINPETAVSIAKVHQKCHNTGGEVLSVNPVILNTDTIAWAVALSPQGFVLVGSRKTLPPILGWSEESNFNNGGAWDFFLPALEKIILQYEQRGITDSGWDKWLTQDVVLSQQWPPDGWSPTGGWLFTNWTQTAPYNNMCPLDGNTGTRSYAGCPATAMSQILNYHREIHSTRFTDDDDYYHNYGSGNQFWIDDDWSSFGFPSFDDLNVYLDTLEQHFTDSTELTDNDMAALTFACGVAAHQVYSSSGSGTFGIGQAYESFYRFGFTDAVLVDPSDPDLNIHLAKNMKAGLPAHLGLVDVSWSTGHNVVVDGYSTEELYHFNFGWGGSANGWYTMPPTSIPYNLTVIEGVVMDINISALPSGITQNDIPAKKIWYNKQSKEIMFEPVTGKNDSEVYIYNCSGMIVLKKQISAGGSSLSCKNLEPGFYVAKVTGKKTLKFVIE